MANTNSGFSATLLKDTKGNYTLSFRSTESKSPLDGGDVHRDSSNGANGEIKDEGFAWAQIMDMEKYYNDLKEVNLALGDTDPLVKDAFSNPDIKISVTGYSLGSHLAQTFTRMHEGKIEKTFVFNGAGMGQFVDIESSMATVPEDKRHEEKRKAYGARLTAIIGELQQNIMSWLNIKRGSKIYMRSVLRLTFTKISW